MVLYATRPKTLSPAIFPKNDATALVEIVTIFLLRRGG
jgi:hypothetical protein